MNLNLIQKTAQYGEGHEAVKQTKEQINNLKDNLSNKTKKMIEQGLSVVDPLEYRQNLITEIITIESIKSSFDTKAMEYKKLVENYNKDLDNLPGKQLSFARLKENMTLWKKTILFSLRN